MRIRTAYDRSGLIERSIDTLKETLAEELAITAIICLIFLLHVRSGLVAAAVLPLGILLAFIVMKLAGINANIMSISGIAVAIGTMVDSSIVMVENLHKHKEHNPNADHWEQVKLAAQEVGPGLFVALLVITVSFLPVFALEGQAGRLFKPLAFTKTFAMAAAALIAVMVIPSLMGFFVRGKTPTEDRNPVNRLCIWIYMPFIRFALRHKLISMAIAFALLAITIVPWNKIGSEFMPPLREGDILFMPTTVPGISVTEARRTLQIQDQLLVKFPEVKVVLGKIGRSSTPTDPAPLAMVETHVSLRPEEDWPKRLIEKGYLHDLATDMLRELKSGDFLTNTGKDMAIAKIAEQGEGMTRAEINRQTRMELVAALQKNMEKLRDGLEKHRDAIKELGDPLPSRFSEERLEDEWAGDLLRQQMERIRPRLPGRIVQQLSLNLVDIFESQGGIAADRKEAAVSRLRERWKNRIHSGEVRLVRTTFTELTKDEIAQGNHDSRHAQLVADAD